MLVTVPKGSEFTVMLPLRLCFHVTFFSSSYLGKKSHL